MATFPGDMNIGWGFGLESREDESSLIDPLLAVSELEQRVSDRRVLEGIRDMVYDHSDVLKQAIQHITDLEERLRSLTFVVNTLVERLDTHIEENTFSVEEFERIGKELEKE